MRHCIIHSPNWGFHITYKEFKHITGNDHACTAGMRILEQMNDYRVNAVCKDYGIPEDHLPPDELLWIPEQEVSLRKLEDLCCGVRGKSSLAHVLDATDPRSLIRRGLVKLRYVARPGNDRIVPIARIRGLIQRDDYGTFVVVADAEGHYEHEGAQYNAVEDGYAWISKQYLYCFDEVNERIAKLDGRSAPKPLPRWTQKSAPALQGTSQKNPTQQRNARNTQLQTTIEGGYLQATGHNVVFDKQNTTSTGNMSMRASNEAIRIASWGIETLLSLVASILAIPAKATESVALAAWLRDWEQPAQWLLNATADLDPKLAWERIERQIRGMLHGPTWYATERTQTPFTLRHVVGFDSKLFKATGEVRLTGGNWETVRKELKAARWYPNETTSYDGPPLEYAEEESSATGPITAPEPQDAVVEAEEPVAVWGMTRIAAQSLCSEIWQYYPRLSLAVGPVGNERYFVCMKVAKEHWHDLASEEEWRTPSEETVVALEQALVFVGVPSPTDSDGDEDEDAPTTEPLDSVALPPIIEEPSLPTSLVPLVVAPPTKTGMSLFVAQALLRQILATGYTARLHGQGEERATILVETQAGTWQDFDSSAAWQRWLKSSAGPPMALMVQDNVAGRERTVPS